MIKEHICIYKGRDIYGKEREREKERETWLSIYIYVLTHGCLRPSDIPSTHMTIMADSLASKIDRWRALVLYTSSSIRGLGKSLLECRDHGPITL